MSDDYCSHTETVQYPFGHLRLRIMQDTDPSNPREDDNAGQMVCFANRYNLGDGKKYKLPEGVRFMFDVDGKRVHNEDKAHTYFSGEGEFHDAEEAKMFMDAIVKDGGIVMPLYLYDHSGITMSTSRTGQFADQWDAGQVGWIYLHKQTIWTEWGKTAKSRKQAYACLEGEVETYDQYLTGDVWGYVIDEVDEDGETIDENLDDTIESCWGFYGSDYCQTEGQSMLKHLEESHIPSRIDSIPQFK